jgi:CDP-glucose 4,6-dehydratase
LESLEVTPEFWRNRRVLITGHTGFKGSWLTLWLDRLGAKATGLALAPPAGPNLFELTDVGSHCSSVFADIRDLDKVQHAINQSRPEIVFHLAARSLVRESYRSPIDTFSTNVLGTANILEAIRNSTNVRAVVVVTSDKCYENTEQSVGYRESDAMGGCDPYSASKGAAELVTASFRCSFFHAAKSPAVASARAGNVIGGGDFAADRLIPDCVRAARDGHSIAIRNPNSTRPWQFVLDPLHGYIDLAERLFGHGRSYAEPWNFGPAEHDVHTVREICEQFASMLASGGRPVTLDLSQQADQPHEAGLLHLDTSKARERLHWAPVLPVKDAVTMTASWYVEYLKNGDVAAITRSQIDSFTTLTQRARA